MRFRATAFFMKMGARRFKFLVGSLVNLAGLVILINEALNMMP